MPHATTGVSPSSLFFGRSLQIRLDLLKPQAGAQVQSKQANQKSFQDSHSRVRQFSVGHPVMAHDFRDGLRWVPRVIVKILGTLLYVIQVRGGQR